MAAQALEQSALEQKDKAQLVQIADALGVKTNSRSKKADIIGQILERAGGAAGNGSRPSDPAPATAETSPSGDAAPDAPSAEGTDGGSSEPQRSSTAPDAGAPDDDEPKAEWELALDADASSADASGGAAPAGVPKDGGDKDGGDKDGGDKESGDQRDAKPASQQGATAREDRPQRNDQDRRDGNRQPQRNDQRAEGDGESRSKRRRRRRKKGGGGVGNEGPQGDDRELLDDDDDAPVSNDPVRVEGYLDMRDEGYGFLRVNNYLASKSDSYLPVKMSRQYGLRKGDHVVGMSRPAGRNEKNPAMLEIYSVNGRPPEEAKRRRRFEDLTALFPDEKLPMEDPSDPANMTARIIDLVSPIGKGQRGLIVSPPKAGKTTIMKTIAASIEKNAPDCKLIVLLIDERPEEVTDMRRLVGGEVIASTFDKPSDQHTQIAEMAIEKAKRLVEYGEDVVVMLDGITRLSRAYNLAAPASGRILSGGIDAGALYPPKRFFGAARNVEEGGSLTILATALVETNSRMDEAVFEEFKGTGNMELRLDRRLAERRIYPAIDVDASSTRHEELLFDRKQLQMVWKLRRVLSGLAADGNAAPGLELLVDRLKTFRNNDDFLMEIAKQPGM